MNIKDLNNVIRDQFQLCSDLLVIKGKEYALEEDRLLAFKKAAALEGINYKEALGGMLAKHIVSIYDMLEGAYPIEKWNEKITDAINYLVLLKALVVEENYG